MTHKISKNKAYLIPVIIIFTLLFLYGISVIALYFWGFLSSLKTNEEFMFNMIGLPGGLPWEWAWGNYARAFVTINVKIVSNGIFRTAYLTEMFLNSVLYAYGGALLTVFCTWVMAYMFVKFPYRLSKFLYKLNLVLMVIPIIGNLPSAMFIYKSLGLYDTWLFVIINATGYTGMYLLVFHSFLEGVGKEFTEAAQMDGASNMCIMMRIIFPLTVQMFFVIFLLVAISRWNDYMTMVIWLPNHPTLAYGLYKFSFNTSVAEASWPPLQIAGCMVLMLPILLLFLMFSDSLMGNLRMGAMKG